MLQGTALVEELINKGIKVHILNIGVMDNTPASKLIRNIFFSFVEFEREMIVEKSPHGNGIYNVTKITEIIKSTLSRNLYRFLLKVLLFNLLLITFLN